MNRNLVDVARCARDRWREKFKQYLAVPATRYDPALVDELDVVRQEYAEAMALLTPDQRRAIYRERVA